MLDGRAVDKLGDVAGGEPAFHGARECRRRDRQHGTDRPVTHAAGHFRTLGFVAMCGDVPCALGALIPGSPKVASSSERLSLRRLALLSIGFCRKTNVVGFSKIAAEVSGVAWVTTLIPVRAGGFARHQRLDPAPGLNFRRVLGDALRDERGPARRLSRVA
jgi:hypothetical protein